MFGIGIKGYRSHSLLWYLCVHAHQSLFVYVESTESDDIKYTTTLGSNVNYGFPLQLCPPRSHVEAIALYWLLEAPVTPLVGLEMSCSNTPVTTMSYLADAGSISSLDNDSPYAGVSKVFFRHSCLLGEDCQYRLLVSIATRPARETLWCTRSDRTFQLGPASPAGYCL